MKLEEGMRIETVRGSVRHSYSDGQRGRLVRQLSAGEWLVKLDGRFFGTTVRVGDMKLSSS